MKNSLCKEMSLSALVCQISDFLLHYKSYVYTRLAQKYGSMEGAPA